MFTNVSMAGTGMFVFIIMTGLNWAGVVPDQNQVVAVVNSVVTLGSFLLWVWGQLSRKDLMLGLLRK